MGVERDRRADVGVVLVTVAGKNVVPEGGIPAIDPALRTGLDDFSDQRAITGLLDGPVLLLASCRSMFK